MFTTYAPFKHPVQFGDEPPAYMAVELTLNAPWLIAESVEGDFTRTLLLDGLTELNAVFLEQSPFGELERLSLIFPPTWSTTGEWRLAKIQGIQRRAGECVPTSLVLVAHDGMRFTGMPISICEDDMTQGEDILRLPTGPRA